MMEKVFCKDFTEMTPVDAYGSAHRKKRPEDSPIIPKSFFDAFAI